MVSMFSGASSFNQDLNDWDVRNVNDMEGMFYDATAFNGDINTKVVTVDGEKYTAWDVSSVTNMSYMFSFATVFNQPLSDWDTSSVTNMYGMFYKATAFNKDISGWCVTNIDKEPDNFRTNSSLLAGNMPDWSNCPTLGVDDQNLMNVSLYPNPTDNTLFISGNATPIAITIYNLLGKEVLSIKNTNNINVQALPSGLYMIRLSDGVRQTNRKFVKN